MDCSDQADGTFFSHETNCWQFYECDHHKKVLFNCTDCLYWDNENHVCNYPESVDCGSLHTSTGKPCVTPTTPHY